MADGQSTGSGRTNIIRREAICRSRQSHLTDVRTNGGVGGCGGSGSSWFGASNARWIWKWADLHDDDDYVLERLSRSGCLDVDSLEGWDIKINQCKKRNEKLWIKRNSRALRGIIASRSCNYLPMVDHVDNYISTKT